MCLIVLLGENIFHSIISRVAIGVYQNKPIKIIVGFLYSTIWEFIYEFGPDLNFLPDWLKEILIRYPLTLSPEWIVSPIGKNSENSSKFNSLARRFSTGKRYFWCGLQLNFINLERNHHKKELIITNITQSIKIYSWNVNRFGNCVS
jgi:hypothetical protein